MSQLGQFIIFNNTAISQTTMVSFTAAVTALLAVVTSTTNGFTSYAPNKRSATILQSTTESFQRSLLEAQIANSASTTTPAEHVVVTSINGSTEQQSTNNSIATQQTQNALLRIAASTDRGQYTNPTQKDQVAQLISSLESSYETPTVIEEGTSIPSYHTGTWELVYSNTQLFRSSPFFLAGRSTCKTEEQAAQYDWFCNMHRAALAISNIGVVRQVITSEGKIINEFNVKVGAIPFLSDFTPFKYSGGLPLTIDGSIVSTADVTATSNSNELELFMDTVEIKGSNIPILRNILDRDNVALKSRSLSKILEDNVSAYEVPKPVLKTTYIDDNMRIVRDVDDNIFVYGKVSDSQEATDYSGVLPDLGIVSLLEGFNDAVTKIYL